MGSEKAGKIMRAIIQFKDNGYVVETHSYNPYGLDQVRERVTQSFDEAVEWIRDEKLRNQRLDAEKNAEQVSA